MSNTPQFINFTTVRTLYYQTKDTAPACSRKGPLAFAVGIILCLGGIFLTLAAHQILPFGPNLVSHLAILGQGIGYGVMVVGAILGVVAAVVWYLTRCSEKEEEDAAILAFVREKLKRNDVYAVNNSEAKTVTYLYASPNGPAIDFLPGEYCMGYKTSPDETISEFQTKYGLHGESVLNQLVFKSADDISLTL